MGERGVVSLRRRQVERTRVDLIDAAYDVVRSDGIEKATLEQIAAAAGTSRATLYIHFPGGREEVLHAAFLRMGEKHVAAAQQRIADTGASTLIARLGIYASVGYELIENTRVGYFMNMYGPSLMRSSSGPYEAGNLERALTDELTAAAARGELRSDVVVPPTATLLAGALRETAATATTAAHPVPDLLAALSTFVRGLVAN
jgi:AcrR family transcriptional regulator